MVSRRVRDDLFLLFGAAGGAIAWTVQLWLSWLATELGCQMQPGGLTVGGLGTNGLWIIVGLATGALAFAALWVSWWLARRGHLRDDEHSHGARRFIAACAVVLNALLLATIVLGTTSPLFLPPCD